MKIWFLRLDASRLKVFLSGQDLVLSRRLSTVV